MLKFFVTLAIPGAILGLSLSFESVRASETCSAIDHTARLGAPRDQGDSGWCYAHVAADLLTAHTGQRISAVDLAIQYSTASRRELRQSPASPLRDFLLSPEQERRFWEGRDQEFQSFRPRQYLSGQGLVSLGGSEDSAIAIGQWRGLCRESDLPEREVGDTGLRAFRELRQRLRRNEVRTLLELGSRRIGECELSPGDPTASRTANLNEFAQIMTGGLREQVIQYADRKCGERLRIEPPVLPQATVLAESAEELEKRLRLGQLRAGQVRAELQARIDAGLSAGRPVAISYSAYDVMTPDDDARHADHASVISARRMRAGRCEYFVRNSWGQDCSAYRPQFRSRCESARGGVWVSLDQLPSLYGVIDLPGAAPSARSPSP